MEGNATHHHQQLRDGFLRESHAPNLNGGTSVSFYAGAPLYNSFFFCLIDVIVGAATEAH